MADESTGSGTRDRNQLEEKIRESHERDWHRWSVGVLLLGLAGLTLTGYTVLRPQSAASGLPGPLIYGLVAALVLFNFYVAEKRAMIQGLRQVLITQKIENELNREMTLIDPITEVYSRRYLRPLLAREVSRVKRYGEEITVMMVDITGFRRVNDSLGQTGGDVVLKEVARLLQTCVRNADIVVRFGGDEFVLILPGTSEANSETLSRRVKKAIRTWGEEKRMTEFNLGFAVGAARYEPGTAVDQLLKTAEERLMLDKTAGATVEVDTTPPIPHSGHDRRA